MEIAGDFTTQAAVERAKSMALDWLWAIRLQHSRLSEPRLKDKPFHPFDRDWQEADLHFLVIALGRLRASATIVKCAPESWAEVSAAIARFDSRLPWRKQMRDVFEHLEDYGIDSKRRRSGASRRGLDVWHATGSGVRIPIQANAENAKDEDLWNGALDVDWNEALAASEDLYAALQKAYAALAPFDGLSDKRNSVGRQG